MKSRGKINKGNRINVLLKFYKLLTKEQYEINTNLSKGIIEAFMGILSWFVEKMGQKSQISNKEKIILKKTRKRRRK